MPCCDTGRNIQKYKGAAASTLQDVTDNGNTTTGDIITTTGYFIGDGSKLTGISGASAAFTLQETSDRGNTTSNVIQFTNPITSLTTSGNVIVAGNVTASKFYGDGTTLNGVALSVDLTNNVTRISILESNLADNVTRIDNLESNLADNVTRISILESNLADNVTRIGNLESNLVSNASRISTLENETQPVNRGGTNITTYAKGDILIASATDTLSNLGLGQSGYVLTSNATTTLPEWRSASSIGATVAELKTGNYLAGGPFNGSSEATFDVEASNTNTADYIVARDSSGDIFVSNVNAIQYYGDGGTLSNIVGSQNLQDVINQNPYTNSPPYFGAGSYGAIYGSNTITASTISTTIGFYGPIKGSNTITTSGVYGPIKGSNTITAGTISTATGFYGPIKGSNTITAGTISTATGFYGPINGSNTISGTTLNVDSLISDDASAINKLNASNINSGTLSNAYGGTGFTTYNQGDLLVGTSDNHLKKLQKGTIGQVLTVNSSGSDIEWQAASGGNSLWSSGTGSDIYYNSGNVSISNSTTNHTVHLGSNVIVNDTGNYDVFRVNGNVFTTGYFVGDGSQIINLKTIKTEADADIIIASDGGPVSYTNRFYR
jgi:hypothetical protein